MIFFLPTVDIPELLGYMEINLDLRIAISEETGCVANWTSRQSCGFKKFILVILRHHPHPLMSCSYRYAYKVLLQVPSVWRNEEIRPADKSKDDRKKFQS